MKWRLLSLTAILLTGAGSLFAQNCTYNINPPVINVSANGGVNSINVVTNSGSCAWSYTTDSPAWITLSASGGTNNSAIGGGVLQVTTLASTLPNTRSGNVYVTGGNVQATIAINQGPATCSMTLNPVTATLPVTGGSSSFAIQTSCSWAATSTALWITVGSSTNSGSASTATSPVVSGTGNGMVTYTAAPNTCVTSQTGTIVVTSQPNQIFTVTEAGSPANLSLSPSTFSAPQAGTSGHVNVVTGDPCAWSSFADVGWIHINTNTTGTGNGGIGFTIDSNSGGQRSGGIHVGSQVFTITQAGATVAALQVTGVNNGASYNQGNIAPGEIVSLFGTNLGPVVGVPLQLTSNKQAITNSLGGVQVLFDGNPAPLIYVSGAQINAIAPVAIAGKTSTQVQVTYQGNTSNTVTVPVAAAAPGIFAADGSGVGGGAILNQDYSLNARLNPAARGSVIAIYLTGAGATTPASVDGAVTGSAAPFPSIAQPVGVTIGGISVPAAQVVYSGAAPGSVEGLIQIDAYIPQSVPPGTALPIVVTVGGVSSQPGITVSVN